ncbi:hypothetical protein HMPREF9551_00895 [Escherichia coli MS 196-1]|nr:hypothetical protein HMPREF9551_00895 [Escherichia coli MS 196-1]
MHFTDTTGIGDVFPVMRGFQHHMMHMQHPGQGCAEFFNMLFMGMLAGLYPAERDNLHIIRVRAKPRVSDCNVVSVKPCAGCPVGQKTHFPGFWGGGCVVIFHGATTHSTGLMLSRRSLLRLSWLPQRRPVLLL